VAEAARGEPFVIAKAGKPLVKVVGLDAPSPPEARRLGFMSKQLKVPDDFDRMGEDAFRRLFGKTR
jgi:antitoxin (DNA-binding transcriptional repressor) of toxin-antitoxin stability system